MKKKHYGAIDGLRMIAAFGIVMMHMSTNNNYEIEGFVYNRIIPSFTNFVYLFMVVSAFGMCCGYYQKVLNNQISWSDFYGKRFKKILPFFGLLVLIDVVMSHSLGSLCEGFADLTLVFGFLPADSISVIGVGWFLGLVFVFYLIFPFFCVLIENKRRAWMAFGVSLIYNFVCICYFDVGRKNILYSACFFLAGGLIYLYRNQIARFNSWIMLGAAWISIVLYYVIGGYSVMNLLVSAMLLMYAITKTGGLLDNRVTKFFSGISMEIYLSHMFIFRVIEKLGIHTVLGNGWLQYIVTVVVVIAGASVFAIVMQKIFNGISKKLAA
ncbi:acyltransferase family protein [Blautia sp. MSJ-19]|uniref:acyltransferase family protein n=1 Tax=Blautia sp. MSJ-19 TaxID=2841517 RepID=UPI001C0EC92A|nr:acyltransferase [Blautia sp. MSJ-19]MBU5480111.1 acyltransferase [Blautia sp. MSJ-19]